MKIEYKNQIVLVTGAARGIGKNIAERFAEAGATVIIADKNEHDGYIVANKIVRSGFKAKYFKVDLGKIKDAEEMIVNLFAEYGHIDAMINNARGGKRTAPLNETEENWQITVDISLKAPLFMSQIFIKSIKDIERGSSIINISSIAANLICGESAAYHLTKAGLENLTRYLAVHGGPKKIRINAIRPGFIVQDEYQKRYLSDSNFSYRKMAEFSHPLNSVGFSDDVANAAMFLCSEKASFITGQILGIDGGLTIQDQWDLIHRNENQKYES